jgi:hypothetical protein
MKTVIRTLMIVPSVVLVAVHADAITVDGQWNDWFSYSGTSDSNWNQSAASSSRLNTAYRYGNDSDSDANGGQNYDAEQIFYYYEDADVDALSGGTLYIGLVTGYEPTNSTYRSGDMFVDLGGEGGFNLAVATGTESSSRFGDIWHNDGWSTGAVVISAHSGSNPYRVENNAAGATAYGNAQIDWDYGVGPGSAHNFLEIGLAIQGSLESLLANGIGLHWTMQCGNDAINVVDTTPLTTIPVPPSTPNNPVPEPATVALLGMGTLGLALRSRRPQI